jgi:hypothetical protein
LPQSIRIRIQAQAVQPIIIQILCQATVAFYLRCRSWFKYDSISILFWTDYTNLEPLNVSGKSILNGVDTCFRRSLDNIWTTETAIQVHYNNCTNYCIQLKLLYISVQPIIGLIANRITVLISFHKVSAAQSNFGKATINSLNILSCLFYSGYTNIPSKYLSTISWCLNLIIFEVKCKSYKVIVDGLAELCGMIWLNHIRTFMSSLNDKTPFKASIQVSGSSFIF